MYTYTYINHRVCMNLNCVFSYRSVGFHFPDSVTLATNNEQWTLNMLSPRSQRAFRFLTARNIRYATFDVGNKIEFIVIKYTNLFLYKNRNLLREKIMMFIRFMCSAKKIRVVIANNCSMKIVTLRRFQKQLNSYLSVQWI